MEHIKVIETPEEHDEALERLMALMDADPQPGSCEADQLDVLSVLIERYEEEQFPIDMPSPVDAIKFRMEQQDLKNKDLVPYIGSAPKVTEVLNGKRKLSLNMIRKLHEGLGIPAEVLIQDPVQKTASEKDIDWTAFPLSEMRQREYFEDFEGSLQELKEYASEWVTQFLSKTPGGFNLRPAMLRTTAHLRSNDKESDDYALWAWQARVLQKAQLNKLPCNYEAGTVTTEWMRDLARLSWSEQGPSLAVEYLNRSGIHLIIEPHLPKTYLDGAACISPDGNPVIALTLRYDRLDSFWFTLMHELSHLCLHFEASRNWFIDDLDSASMSSVEEEADDLAEEALIPESAWPAAIRSPEQVVQLANELRISQCIVAGRVRHELGDHRLFGKRFREKIRPFFNQP